MELKGKVWTSVGLIASATSLYAANGDVAADAPKGERPNIVWFLAEDLSPHYLALFNEGRGAVTPNLERLAEEGLIYTNAYSNAPVSSAARTTLITGCYAPRFAGSLHRKMQEMPMPEGLSMFPAYLRRNGYYTCNASKTDYNVVFDEEAWDRKKGDLTTWRNRPDKKQPFFYQRNNTVSHESCLHFGPQALENKKTVNNPADVYIHPNLPDTKLMRYTYATFYDRIQKADKELGQLVDMLREDGVLDNTFIFFFGDNGGSLPGTKGYTDDIGIHVPLVVYVPEKWRDKIDLPVGTRQDGLVSFMDFAPTVLNLAGVEVPEQMDGTPFLGKGAVKGQECIFGYGDRFDELYAFNRVIRKGKYRYARNYQPYHTQSLYALYRYKQLAFQEWKQLYKDNKLNANQSSFFKPFGAEELYDLEKDPMELNNLAENPVYSEVLAGLRKELGAYLVEKADLGFFPETLILEEEMDNPDAYGNRNKKRIETFREVADLQIEDFNEIKSRLEQALKSDDAVERWWGLTTCTAFGKEAVSLKKTAQCLLDDERSYIRARAMVFLSRTGDRFADKDVYSVLDNSTTDAESLLALNDFTYLVESGLLAPFKLEEADVQKSCNGVDWRVKYLKTLYESK